MKFTVRSCLALIAALSVVSAAFADVEINEKNFPDPEFRKYVSETFDPDSNGVLSAEESAAIREIYIFGRGISDLSGIEHFTALDTLYCNNNQLTALDISRNTVLKQLSCSNNQLTALDVSNNTALWELCCSNNQLTELDVSNNTALLDMSCIGNKLTTLSTFNSPHLRRLFIDKDVILTTSSSSKDLKIYYELP